jgi:hypothetical protein
LSPAGQLAAALLLVLSSLVLFRASSRLRGGRYRPVARFVAVVYFLMAIALLGIVLYLRWQ